MQLIDYVSIFVFTFLDVEYCITVITL